MNAEAKLPAQKSVKAHISHETQGMWVGMEITRETGSENGLLCTIMHTKKKLLCQKMGSHWGRAKLPGRRAWGTEIAKSKHSCPIELNSEESEVHFQKQTEPMPFLFCPWKTDVFTGKKHWFLTYFSISPFKRCCFSPLHLQVLSATVSRPGQSSDKAELQISMAYIQHPALMHPMSWAALFAKPSHYWLMLS